MNLYQHTGFKKVVASLLILLFVQIHLVKIFHSHNPAKPASSHNYSIHTFSNSQYCAICDYHLGKDADHQDITFDLLQLHSIKPVHGILHAPALTSFYSLSSDRGPPAC